MRDGPGGKSVLQRCRDGSGEVSDRTEWPRNREVVAGAIEHPRPGFEIADEPGDERRLADSRLAGDEDHTTLASRCRKVRLEKRRHCPFALEELHRPNDRRGSELGQPTVETDRARRCGSKNRYRSGRG
jgi:hypothetical protein